MEMPGNELGDEKWGPAVLKNECRHRVLHRQGVGVPDLFWGV